jgi:anti-anti-sigma factor
VTSDGSKFFATEVVNQILFVTPTQKVASLTGVELSRDRSVFLRELRNSGAQGIVFNLAALEAFGSLMLGTLCLTWKEAHEQGARMALCNVSAIGRQVLERSRLSSLWPIYASQELAIAWLRGGKPANSAQTDSDTQRLGGFEIHSGPRLEIIEAGPRTTVGFGGADLPPEHILGRYLNEIMELIESSGCRELSFDLTGISSVPSGFLGVLASVLKKGVAVSVKHPSREVREVLALTNFDRLIKVL